jgi:alpha-methylacyl-CoA racemase
MSETIDPQLGRIVQPVPTARPAGASGTGAQVPAPALGEHTDEVLAEIGLGADRRADLRRRGVIG